MDNTKVPFNSLPCDVQESLLWEMELDYDGYESSMAETIHYITCGSHLSHTNDMIIKNFYAALSPERLRIFIANVDVWARTQIEGCNAVTAKLDSLGL